jgi:hypothetical protein
VELAPPAALPGPVGPVRGSTDQSISVRRHVSPNLFSTSRQPDSTTSTESSSGSRPGRVSDGSPCPDRIAGALDP